MIKEFFNSIERFFNGKKTHIAGVSALTIGFLQSQGHIDAPTAQFSLSLTAVLFGVGVGHKVKKHYEK